MSDLIARLQICANFDPDQAEAIKVIQAQAVEIAALQKRCEEAERTALQAAECHAREMRRADALQKRVAELEAALDFYACVDHYQTHNAVAPNVVQTDRGAKARAALTGGKDEQTQKEKSCDALRV